MYTCIVHVYVLPYTHTHTCIMVVVHYDISCSADKQLHTTATNESPFGGKWN